MIFYLSPTIVCNNIPCLPIQNAKIENTNVLFSRFSNRPDVYDVQKQKQNRILEYNVWFGHSEADQSAFSGTSNNIVDNNKALGQNE